VRAAFTKVVVTAGGSVLLTFGKETEITNFPWDACEVKRGIINMKKRRRGKEYILNCWEHSAHNFFDSKVLNAICVSLNPCHLASYSNDLLCC
jgi:hypothetical protein